MSRLSQKSLELLRFLDANPPGISRTWPDRFRQADGLLSKPTLARLEKLYRRGYIECGVSVAGAWLTDKGREALDIRSTQLRQSQ